MDGPLAPRQHGPAAEPDQVDAAANSQRVEQRRAKLVDAHDGRQRQPAPEHVARKMPEQEARSGGPPVLRGQREHREEGRARRHRIDEAGQDGRGEEAGAHGLALAGIAGRTLYCIGEPHDPARWDCRIVARRFGGTVDSAVLSLHFERRTNRPRCATCSSRFTT